MGIEALYRRSRTQHPGSGGGDLSVFHRRGAPQSARSAARRTSTGTRRKDSLLRYKRWAPARRPTRCTSASWLRRAGGRLKIGRLPPALRDVRPRCGEKTDPPTPDEKPVSASGATPVSGRESDSDNQPPFRTRDDAVTIWLYIIGEREVDGVCRAVFALHEQMVHGAGLAPEEVADFSQRERRGFVDRRDHVAFR